MSEIIICRKCSHKNHIRLGNKLHKCRICKNKLTIRKKENYSSTNLETINVWEKELKEKFKSNLIEEKNLLERTKIIKSNILQTLNMAEKLASISNDKNIFDTSSSLKSIEKEIDKIKQDVVSISVFGQMSSGKSSFLNSLVGEKLLTVSQERATATITVIRHIDNFEGQKDGNIEIHYKSENEIIFNLKKAVESLDKYFTNEFSDLNLFSIEEVLENREALLAKLSNVKHSRVDRSFRKEVKGSKKIIELILNNLDENINYLGTISEQDVLEKNELISSDKSVFINNIIFYKDIPLLKNIELIDTPGLGSNSQLDTRKSEEFIEKADIVILLTDAKEPMQKDSEEDILHILEDIQQNQEDSNFFDKVFIVVNKIDDCENNRDEIKELLEDSLDDAEITINNNHILFISARYEYLKRCDKTALDSFHINNKENIQMHDLEYIEKTIYNFSTAEATSKFLTKHLNQIDKIFDEVERNFKGNLEKIGENINITEEKIDKFSKNKDKIKTELEETLTRMIKDEYRVLQAKAYNIMDDELKKVSTYDYFKNIVQERKSFEKSKNEKDSERIAKNLMKEIINESNQIVEKNIKKNIFNVKQNKVLKIKLQEKTKKVQKKYENDYGVVLNLDDIAIGSIKINLNNNVDLEVTTWKSFKLFINPLLWGKADKYIDAFSEKWEEYSNNEYKDNIKEEIKKQKEEVEKSVQKEISNAITNIVETIDNQLKQELRDQEKLLKNKEETMQRKLKIQNSFTMLQKEYISKIKEQNKVLFEG